MTCTILCVNATSLNQLLVTARDRCRQWNIFCMFKKSWKFSNIRLFLRIYVSMFLNWTRKKGREQFFSGISITKISQKVLKISDVRPLIWISQNNVYTHNLLHMLCFRSFWISKTLGDLYLQKLLIINSNLRYTLFLH